MIQEQESRINRQKHYCDSIIEELEHHEVIRDRKKTMNRVSSQLIMPVVSAKIPLKVGSQSKPMLKGSLVKNPLFRALQEPKKRKS